MEINCTEVCEGEFMDCSNCRHIKKLTMKEQINNVINYIKSLDKIHGCISGSCMLNTYWEGMDVDIFCYDKSSFIKLYYTLKFNPMFLILDPVQQWSSGNLEEDIDRQFKKRGVVSIKFTYNTCLTVNVVWKSDATNIYGVISSFDVNIIAKGYDLLTKKELDLTEGSTITKIADWNKFNTKFYKSDIWSLNSILRQFIRIEKYHNRGYDMDLVAKKYISIIDDIQAMENIFKSPKYDEILELNKKNTKLVKEVLVKWLEVHTLTDKERELVELKIKELN